MQFKNDALNAPPINKLHNIADKLAKLIHIIFSNWHETCGLIDLINP